LCLKRGTDLPDGGAGLQAGSLRADLKVGLSIPGSPRADLKVGLSIPGSLRADRTVGLSIASF
jgi:hypothetical protein